MASPNVSCLSAFVQDSSTVVCTLPPLDASTITGFAGQSTTIRVLFNASTTNAINRVTYNYPNAPTVLSVIPAASSGCTTSTDSTTTLSNCGSSAVVTLTGRYLSDTLSIFASGPVVNNAYYYLNPCTVESNYTDSAVVCSMPPIAAVSTRDDVVAGFMYEFQVLAVHNGSLMRSNVFRVSFAPLAVLPETDTSSTGGAAPTGQSKLSTGATAGVVVAGVVLVAVAVVVVFFFVRHRRASASNSPKSDDRTRRQLNDALDSSASGDGWRGVEMEMEMEVAA